ncbi:hypothetical protein ACE7GA_17430 [Roseomonas sp. CCTCC AB2023176]|uniref:hypothetical protein n=1 Tax=Roseomonas sp. CCTCC AB2023176 TaxID=3342640 RepID=UPI0035E1D1B6
MRWLLLLPLLGACTDDFSRPGTWQATGINDVNLRAMLANPGDLQHGAVLPGGNGTTGAAAVTRLNQDRLRPLPAVSGRGGNTATPPPGAPDAR